MICTRSTQTQGSITLHFLSRELRTSVNNILIDLNLMIFPNFFILYLNPNPNFIYFTRIDKQVLQLILISFVSTNVSAREGSFHQIRSSQISDILKLFVMNFLHL